MYVVNCFVLKCQSGEALSCLYNLTGVVLGCDPIKAAQVADGNVRSLRIDDVRLPCLQETDSTDEVIEHIPILFYCENSDNLAVLSPMFETVDGSAPSDYKFALGIVVGAVEAVGAGEGFEERN